MEIFIYISLYGNIPHVIQTYPSTPEANSLQYVFYA